MLEKTNLTGAQNGLKTEEVNQNDFALQQVEVVSKSFAADSVAADGGLGGFAENSLSNGGDSKEDEIENASLSSEFVAGFSEDDEKCLNGVGEFENFPAGEALLSQKDKLPKGDLDEHHPSYHRDDEGFRDALQDSLLSPENKDANRVFAKYNGRNIPLDRQAAETLAKSLDMSLDQWIATFQKGMNYDHVAAELHDLRKRPEALAGDLPREQGLVQGGIPQEELSAGGRFGASAKALTGDLPREQGQTADEYLRSTLAWMEFRRAYPQMRPQDIPGSVLDAWQAGESPVQAMQKVELEKLNREVQNLKISRDNQAKAIGSVRTEAALENDDFLSGFWGN